MIISVICERIFRERCPGDEHREKRAIFGDDIQREVREWTRRSPREDYEPE